MWGQASPYGRTLHFGVREHAMGAILNGIALHGGTRAYGGTFLIFSDYMRPAVRLAALMKLPTIYIWTHDSIGLGEDGPTHQPVEHLAALRAIPGLARRPTRPTPARPPRPSAGILESPTGPAGLALTRQNVPILEGVTTDGVLPAATPSPTPSPLRDGDGCGRRSCSSPPVPRSQLALAAREVLERTGCPPGSCPCPASSGSTRRTSPTATVSFLREVTARVAVEAAIGLTWHRFVGDHGEIVSIEHFGASADYQTLYQKFGLTTDAIVEAARRSLSRTSA